MHVKDCQLALIGLFFLCISRHSWTWCPNESLRYSSPLLALHPADSCLPESRWMPKVYDLPLLYWDCLTPPSLLIHPPENPNALIPRGNHFFFFNNLLSNDLLIVASTLRENYRSFLGNQIFTPWVCMWHRSPETVWGETDFEEQWCVNLCVVTPLLPMVCPVDSPVILCCSLYSVALFISW